MPLEPVYTVPEVAAALKVQPSTVRAWLRTGALGGVRISSSGGWRVPETEVARFLREGKRAA